MPKKVLIVDNNPVIIRLFTNMFEKENYEVKTAKDGLEALHTLELFRPALMLVDLIMPKISGEKLCRIIRKMPEFNSTFIVIVSAIAAEEKVDFLSFGANACIAKGPFREMQAHIATILQSLDHNETGALSQGIMGRKEIREREITRELLATKKHLEITLDNITNGFLELTPDAKIIYTNRAATKLFRASEEELLASIFLNLFPTEQQQLIQDHFFQLKNNSLEIGRDTPIILYGKYLLIRMVPFFDEGQKFIIVLLHDITEQKLSELELISNKEQLEDTVARRTAEYEEANQQLQDEIAERVKVQEQLVNSSKQWRETFDIMSDFVSVHDKDMKLVKVNKSLAKLLGKKPAELIGQKCFQLFHNTSKPWSNCPHVMAMAKGEIVTEEVEDPYLGKTLLITCSPIFDLNDTVMGTVHVARDITNQKRAQKDKEALIKKLQASLDEIKSLRGILPFCSFCKKIRDDKGYWEQVDVYIHKYSDADISHSICPECMKKHYPEEYQFMVDKAKKGKE